MIKVLGYIGKDKFTSDIIPDTLGNRFKIEQVRKFGFTGVIMREI